MHTYDIPLVPGPTTVPAEVLAAYTVDYGSADLEPEYAALYAETQEQLREIIGTRNQIAIMSGEGMLALWGALKSCLKPGDRVVAVDTGIFGLGIGQMAQNIGAKVYFVHFPPDTIAEVGPVEEAIRRVRPKMVTLVHCETPSGTLNPVAEIGELIEMYDVPLFYVDAVSSAGGAPLAADDWHVDLCLVGTQKCLSAPPDLAIVSISERAWEIIAEVGYQGYDALLPWRTALAEHYFPYTPCWHATAALNVACRLLLKDGLSQSIQRHAEVARLCRQGLAELGLELFPRQESFSSPTVTAVKVPSYTNWRQLDAALRARGMVVGGSWGELAGKIFRIGHMGAQADADLVRRGLAILGQVLEEARG